MNEGLWWPKEGSRVRCTVDSISMGHFRSGDVLDVVRVHPPYVDFSGCGCGESVCPGWMWEETGGGRGGWFTEFVLVEDPITLEEASLAPLLPSAEDALLFFRRKKQ